MLASLGLDPIFLFPPFLLRVAEQMLQREGGASRPLVAAFASATLAGVRATALARYRTIRLYLERTSCVAGVMELDS